MRQVLIGSVAVLTMAAAGCEGSGGDGNDTDSGDSADGGGVSTEHPEPGDAEDANDGDDDGDDGSESAVPAGQVDSSELPEGYPTEVTSTEDGQTLTLSAMERNGCVTASTEVAASADDEVTVLLVHTTEAGEAGDVMCTQEVRYPTLEVDLDEPLGERTVVLETEERER